jgi:hypothetical protein
MALAAHFLRRHRIRCGAGGELQATHFAH